MMSVIGIFRQSKDGGWIGTIRTLTINAKVRFVPNDNRKNENAPAFCVFSSRSRIGDAWGAQSIAEHKREYLRVQIDDPALSKPINAVLFQSDDGSHAKLVWARKRYEG